MTIVNKYLGAGLGLNFVCGRTQNLKGWKGGGNDRWRGGGLNLGMSGVVYFFTTTFTITFTIHCNAVGNNS